MSESKEEELVEFQGKKMYPEVAAYFKVVRAADKVRDEAHADLSYAWEKAEREARYNFVPNGNQHTFDSYAARRNSGGVLREPHRIHNAGINAADNAHGEALRAVRELLTKSTHAPVKWIAECTLRDYPDYSAAVLKALPVKDPAVLWEIKERHGMCSEFDRLYALAEAEGVWNNGKKMHGSRELAALHNKISRIYGSTSSSDIRTAMGPFLKAVREGYEKEIADAKAEWQGLDEAWRSERARRGAATRAANRETVAVNGNHPDVVMENDAVVAQSDLADTFERPTQPGQTYEIHPISPARLESFESVSETEEKVNA